MFSFIILLLILVAISSFSLAIALSIGSLSRYKLQNAAVHGDKNAKRLFALYGMRYRLQAALLLCASVLVVSLILLVDAKVDGPLVIIINSVLIVLVAVVLPRRLQTTAILWAAKLDMPLNKLMSVLSPLIKHFSMFLEQHDSGIAAKHVTKKELLVMLGSKELTSNSDITSEESRMLRKVLTFSEKKIRDVMTPRRMVRLVAAEDELGPVLLDELHASGHSRFPVTNGDDKHLQFLGTLFIRDLALQKKVRKVSELMSPEVFYIHEEESIDKALRAFLRTRHHLFVVVNNFQEFVGVLSVEDALEEVIGKEIVDEADTVEDLREAAKLQADEDVKARKAGS